MIFGMQNTVLDIGRSCLKYAFKTPSVYICKVSGAPPQHPVPISGRKSTELVVAAFKADNEVFVSMLIIARPVICKYYRVLFACQSFNQDNPRQKVT